MGLPQGLLIQRRQQVRGFDPRSPGEARGRVCGLIALDALPPACLCVAKGERSNSSRWPSEKPTCGARVHPNMPIVSMVSSRKCELPRSISADTQDQDREWRAGAAGLASSRNPHENAAVCGTAASPTFSEYSDDRKDSNASSSSASLDASSGADDAASWKRGSGCYIGPGRRIANDNGLSPGRPV